MRPSARHRESATQFPPAIRALSRVEIETAIEAVIERDEDEGFRLIALLDDLDGDCDFEPIEEREPDFDAESNTPVAGGGSGEREYRAEIQHWRPA